jgi:hypothetical protein
MPRNDRVSRRDLLQATAAAGAAALGAGRLLAADGSTPTTGKLVRLTENVPVIDETDICVLGGSCTGVFAAVRAARLGSRVTIVEKQNHFGGVAPVTCTWHSLFDTVSQKKIIAGLTEEVLERLRQRDAVHVIEKSASKGFEFRPGEMKIVLDDLVTESRVRPWLHTVFTAPYLENGKLVGVVVENKSGRGVIKAKAFVDATGDGDLCARLGLAQYRYDEMLPPTTCAFIDHWPEKSFDIAGDIARHGAEFDLKPGFAWGSRLPRTDIYLLAGTRVTHVDCANGADLTRAEIEGRRQVKAIMDMLRKYRPELNLALHDFPTTIGIRDSRHIRCQHPLTGDEVLQGKRFDDAIANGSYRADTHHQDKPGITFLYLDGTREYHRPGSPAKRDRWREKTPVDPTFYQVPLRSLIPGRFDNVILAGRMLDADLIAMSAVRVMVNCNQMGEAAGVTAHLSLAQGKPIAEVSGRAVREALARGGSIVL